jgi:hypothetical protein
MRIGPRGGVCDFGREPNVDVEGQVRPVLLDAPDRQDANLVVNGGLAGLRPSQSFVAIGHILVLLALEAIPPTIEVA